MPRNLSAWIDLTIHLIVMLALALVTFCYNTYVGMAALVLWAALAAFAWERCHDRERRFERYCMGIIRNVNEVMNYAVDRLPQAILVVSKDGHLEWCNRQLGDYLGTPPPEQGTAVADFWQELVIEPLWGMEGEYRFTHEGRTYRVYHRPLPTPAQHDPLMAFYVEDETEQANLEMRFHASRTALLYIQIDNFDEIMQGQTEAERSLLLLAVRERLDAWMEGLGGFMRSVSDGEFVALLDRAALDHAIAEKFDILDQVRKLTNTKGLPVTLSIGLSLATDQSLKALGEEAEAKLDLALGRGGDQVALDIGGKTQFFGGKAKAVEKHTRVKARVVAHALRDIMEGADEVYIMGHHNEDYDCFGAAMGTLCMARALGKKAHIVLSDMNEGIDRFEDVLRKDESYADVFVRAGDIASVASAAALLVVVDAHIPHILADPSLLERIPKVVVIDHHRRSEHFVKNPLLVYIETASSSASELVTELLMYFGENIRPTKFEATALYSGIVVDTKNFNVNTGIRTFDAAAYLRRAGADPVLVRSLFQSDYETTVALARAKATAEFFPGGLIVGSIPEQIQNGQIIASQAADGMLRVDGVRMSIYVFQMTADTVGISARASGDMNVQVIMEQFGGGGHANVAGAQVKNVPLREVRAAVIEQARKYIEESDRSESDTTG
ncbi:DHH family phosphoesterase [Selenomonas artemidis]|jgi:DHH family phosphoesterase|uniref:Cyclic-di-AMP phosphodiesterase n=1 Tax=Selenomonas artemidis F0399 TaxID=749551 RepID=E7N577_9FIRM|nr:DHH family phosphoesterase [Selenomonas artemidis]EFW28651.1 DHHA1 domain protein [Selenomonas artemidis F0399]